ncbi:Tripartite tricarboxylate transporter TctA family protein [Salipiger thiooxidans]|uniref:Tripartite tricarboxylate transporter TctA family protein n=1 Tax=Salipiger thiooxidans TaxID=282683 RepID=A0A1G7G6Q2_9RHOB|nr:Tripartite tricarboxylate transporter TctA family protein [Salipiger thiooxidans]
MARDFSRQVAELQLRIAAPNGTTTRLAQGAFPGADEVHLRCLASFGAEDGLSAAAAAGEINDLPSLILMTSVCYGAMYGGRISTILLDIPGDEPEMMTCLDG